MNRKELPSLVNRDTEPSFHLAAFMRPDMYQWLYEHYINISLRCGTCAFLEWVDNYIDQSYRFMYDSRQVFSFDEVRDNTIDFIKSKIDQNFYIFTYNDKFHISTNGYYHKWHFVHPLIVTGYDEELASFICIDFDPRHGPVRINILYSEFTLAVLDCEKNYMCGAWLGILNTMFVCIRLNQSFIAPTDSGRRRHAHYAFSLDRFISELRDYLYGIPRAGQPYEPFQYQPTLVVYGVRVYDELLRHFDRFVEDKVALRFKVLHDFVLHKWMLWQRLSYICDRYDVSETCLDAVKAYENIYRKAEHLRLLNLKCNMRDHEEFNSLSLNPKFIEAFRKVIPELKKEETEILYEIYNELRNGANGRDEVTALYVDIERGFVGNNSDTEKIVLKKQQSLHRIEITFPPDTPENIIVDLTLNGEVYSILPEHIRRHHAVIDIYPIQCVKELQVRTRSGCIPHLEYRLHTRSENMAWNFNGNLFVCADLESDLHIDRSVHASIYGRDPSIWTKQDFFADELKYLHFCYHTTCQSNTAEILFTNDEGVTSRKRFTIVPMAGIYEYILDMSDHPDWKGRIQMLRFDPISYDSVSESGICEIDSIALTSKPPIYDSNSQFVSAQGLNGWSYHTFNDESTYLEMMIDDAAVHALNHKCVYIDSDAQTSAHQLASARIWTCPADGLYNFKCSAELLTDGRQSRLYIKHNHKKLFSVDKELICGSLIERDAVLMLERGETLRFEFYNDDQNTVEKLKIRVVIEKKNA